MRYSKLGFFAVGFLLSACIFGCGNNPTSDQSAAPSHLIYSQTTVSDAEGIALTDTPTVTGTVSGYSISPALPTGLSLNDTTGIISGIPIVTTPATNYTITATNSQGTATAFVNITVYNTPPSNLSYTDSSISYLGGFSITANTPTVIGTVTRYSISPTLPPGLLFDSTTGIISGAPTATSPMTNYTITASNSLGSTTALVNIAVTWMVRTSGTGSGLRSVIWTGNQYVVVGNGGVILTSPNGLTWTSRASGTANALFAVTWTGSLLVAVGNGDSIFTSPDGVTWTGDSTGVALALNSVTQAGSQTVAVGDSGAILTSTNEVTWTRQNSGTTNILNSVTWTGNQLVAVGDSGSKGLILTSPDGVTWMTQPSTPQNLVSVTWTGGQLVAVGLQTIQTSPDGVTWTSQTAPPFYLNFVTWTGGQLVAVGYGGNNALTSSDGVTWTYGPSSQDYSLNSIVSNGSGLVTVGGAGIILTSF